MSRYPRLDFEIHQLLCTGTNKSLVISNAQDFLTVIVETFVSRAFAFTSEVKQVNKCDCTAAMMARMKRLLFF
jgi:hypothetical protein